MRPGISILLAICWAAVAQAQAVRYVTTPEELQAAIQAAQPGDTIVMADGTWRDVAIVFEANGAPGDTITLRAETPGRVVLTGSSRLRIGGAYLKVEGLRFENGALPDGEGVIEFRANGRHAFHSRLTNTAIVNYNPPGRETEYKWVSLYGRFNRVDHCYFAGKTHLGALLVVWLQDPPNDAPPQHRIDHNYFGPRPEQGENGAEIIRIGTSARSMQEARVVVERNLFLETNGEIEIISNKSGGNIYRGNTFRRCRGTLTLRHGNGALVEGNFFFGEGVAGTGGVRIIGEDHRVINNYFQDLTGTGYYAAVSVVQGVPDSPLNRYFQVKRAVIAHNTFVNTERSFEIGIGASPDQSLPPEDLTIVNNVVQTRLGAPIVTTHLEPIGNTIWAGNIFYGKPGSFPEGAATFAHPELVRGDDGLYRPAPTSPLIDAGRPDFAPAVDMDGQPRSDRAPDVGADEVSDAPIRWKPLTPADVGPNWLREANIEVKFGGRPSRLAPHTSGFPFEGVTDMSFYVERPSHVRISMFDLSGRRVMTVFDERVDEGAHVFRLDGSHLPTGTYLLVMETDCNERDYRLVTIRR